jgi:two-component system, NarL family, nitrate/nitrite response regulator NarL
MSTSIVIADDHPVVLHGLASLIEADPEFSVVGRCVDGIAALAAIREMRPNLAVLDLNMPGMTGREVLAAIVREELGARVVLLTAAATDAELYDTIDAGAAGVVVKDSGIETLLTCLRTIAAGGVWLPDDVVGPAMDRETARRDEWRELSAELTARELEIVRLVLQGSTTKEISFRINITIGTTKVHMSNIFRKLKVSSRGELYRLASGQL